MSSNEVHNESNVVANIITAIGIFAIIISAISAFAYGVINNYISQELRIIIGLLVSFLFIGAGMYLYWRKPSWSLFSMAGGLLIGIITISFAYHQYELFSSLVASILMLGYIVLFFYLSYIYNSLIITSYAGIGGLFVPLIGGFLLSHLLLSYFYFLILFFTIATISILKNWNYLISVSLFLLFFPLAILFDSMTPMLALSLSLIFGFLLFVFIYSISQIEDLVENFSIELVVLMGLLILYLLISIPTRLSELDFSDLIESVVYLFVTLMLGLFALSMYLQEKLNTLGIISAGGSLLFFNISAIVYFMDSVLLGSDGLYFLFLIQWVGLSYIWIRNQELEFLELVSYILLLPIAIMFIFYIRFDQGLSHATIMLMGFIVLSIIAYYFATLSEKIQTYFYLVSLVTGFFFIYSTYKYLFFFFEATSQIPSISLTVMWLLLSIFFVSKFIKLQIESLKVIAYLFLAFSVGKILFNDLWILEGFARIIGFLVVGILLLATGYVLSNRK
ncbi:MAG: DUF2339 domain-containing protein [Candidatus Woesearchaeota archaeon]